MTKILVIDDDISILENVIEWLTFEGFETIGASDGREGAQLALDHLPDLIISDISMPEWDGYRVLLELRSHAETSLIPIIFLTAKVTQREIRYGMELGADDYLTKPFSPQELLGTLRSRLKRVEQSRQHTLALTTKLHHELIYMLPHELRTPLVSILGYSELLAAAPASLDAQEIADIAQNILSSGHRLQHLIENFLLYVQLEQRAADSDNKRLAESVFVQEPDSIVESICKKIASVQERSQDLQLDLTANVPTNIGDSDLTKITTELVENAFGFSKSGSVVVISSRINGGHYQLDITDHGRGMNQEQMQRIGALIQFDRAIYEQQGVGLGLVIAKHLVAFYDGTLSIDSQLGVGTTIRVSIPLSPFSSP